MPAPRKRPSLHVLIVEDHEDSRDMLRQILEYSGLHVSEAATADDALALATATRFDVVITDISLGGGIRDGVWLTQRLQRTAAPIPVVAMTGHKERQDELRRLGFAAVLIKPIDALNLAAIVQGVLRR
jgi:CheY-like chemotaxis protein